MKRNTAILAFNRGLVSRLALGRIDLRQLAFSAETMVNWMPRVLGSMMLRPGWGYLGSTRADAQARFLPFVFSTDDTALIELTDGTMRVWVGDSVITRPAVSSAVTNGDFTTDLTGWTDNDEPGGVSVWDTGGYMKLTGDGTNAAIRDQQVTVAAGDQGVEHALHIVIKRGPVTLSVGSTLGGDDYVATTDLDTGTHSLAFTPIGDFYIRFQSALKRAVLVDSCNVEAAGAMEVSAPWGTNDLNNIRMAQSGDIIFVACKNFLQRKIERRGTRSWSLVWYMPDAGPFKVANTSETTIAASAVSGNITLTASRPLFEQGHIGAQFMITSEGQRVTASISAANTFSNEIEVTGVGEDRRFAITLNGTWSATVTLQRSIGDTANWVDVTSYTANTATTFADSLDNQLVYYRIGIKTGDYTSGTVEASLDYPNGSITGIARVTGYTSSTSVEAEVLKDLGGTAATTKWREGNWSTVNGWPSAVAFFEGRLWFAGNNGVWGSVSDDFYNYDPDVIGDSGPINRTIGSGPVDDINWILPLQRLILGAEGGEFSIRATSYDEALTPSNFNIKETSTQGSISAIAVKVDSEGVFVSRGGTRLYTLAFDGELGDYAAKELTLLMPEIGEPSITHVAVQRKPDTRIHCVRSDGTVAVLVYDRAEKVVAWVEVTTAGSVEDVVVLPGNVEDAVYYVVKRTINGVTKRYLEKWAQESEAKGLTVTKLADAFITYSGAATTALTGLDHLEGETVTIWGNGKDLGTAVVTGGQVTVPEAVTTATVGLPYTAEWKSTKLAFVAPEGAQGLNMRKRIFRLGLVLADVYPQGVRYGPSFTTLDDMPQVEDAQTIDPDTVLTAYDEVTVDFPSEWDPDARLCLEAASPRPCTVLAATISYEVRTS